MHAHRHSNARTHALGTHARAIARTRADARARKRCNVAWCTFLCRISGCRLHRSTRCNGCIVARRTNAARWLTSAARTATTTGTCRSCCARSEIGTSATRPATAGSSRCGAAACAAQQHAPRAARSASCCMLRATCYGACCTLRATCYGACGTGRVDRRQAGCIHPQRARIQQGLPPAGRRRSSGTHSYIVSGERYQ